MASKSLHRWKTIQKDELDKIEHAHAAVGATGRGRWYATQQVNQAYVVLLASHFQSFCRDLHSESIDFLVSLTKPPYLQPILRANLLRGRKLNHGNANFDNIREDFDRLRIDFRIEVDSYDPSPNPLRKKLQALNDWRNAIAHQDFARVTGSTRLQLDQVRQWRGACGQLAQVFDKAIRRYLQNLTGISPW
jgi:RiboL-PSP-HEPN